MHKGIILLLLALFTSAQFYSLSGALDAFNDSDIDDMEDVDLELIVTVDPFLSPCNFNPQSLAPDAARLVSTIEAMLAQRHADASQVHCQTVINLFCDCHGPCEQSNDVWLRKRVLLI